MKTLRILLLVFLLPVSNFSQDLTCGKLSPRTAYFVKSVVQAADNPVYAGDMKKRFRVSDVAGEGREYVSAFVYLKADADIEDLRAMDVQPAIVLPDMATARIPLDRMEEVMGCSAVRRIEIASPVYQNMDEVRLATHADKVHVGADLTAPYTGRDVIIGVIDQGFQYHHINFFGEDNNLRIKRVWTQNGSGPRPEGFNYGTEYFTTESILERQYDYNESTHGTHVAGIAGGSDRYGDNPYYGMAPEADLVFVSYYTYGLGTDNVYLSDAIKYIFDYAGSVDKPCVVNMSLGTHLGPHDGTSAFDRLCDALQGEGRLLVGSAGNEANRNIHIAGDFTAADDTLRSFVAFRNPSDRYAEIDIWSEEGKTFDLQLVVYKKSTGQELFTSPVMEVIRAGEYEFSLEDNLHGSRGKLTVVTEINPVNNKANAYVAVNLGSLTTGNYVGLKIISREESRIDAWADNLYSYLYDQHVEGWESGSEVSSVCEIGGTGKRIISVGAFSTKESYINKNGQEVKTGQALGNIADYSGRGPAGDGRMKPDIAAPGSAVVASYSDLLTSSNVVLTHTVNNQDYLYGAMEGTSMAAPVVTGILATWLEAKNDLTPEEVREIFEKTAIRDSFTEDRNTWGYGKIDAWAGICEIEGMLQGVENTSVEDAFKIFPNPAVSGTVQVSFGEGKKDMAVFIANLDGQQVYHRKLTAAGTHTLDISFLPKGIYLVSVKGNNYYHTQRLIIL